MESTITGTAAAIQRWALARWKWLASLRKDSWDLPDYPIVIRQQTPGPADGPVRLKVPRFAASIVNWLLTGTGETREEAMRDLAANFEVAREQNRRDGTKCPRPGAKVPIRFASQELVDRHPELAAEFIRRVLGLEWAWISDQSSLWDFHTDAANGQLCNKIKEFYGVDVSDIESGLLREIFDRIAADRE
jgi:hypothetical protein